MSPHSGANFLGDEGGSASYPALDGRMIAVLVPSHAAPISHQNLSDNTFISNSIAQTLERLDGVRAPLVLLHAESLSEADLELASRMRDLPGRPLLVSVARPETMDQALNVARRLGLGWILPEDCLLRPEELSRWVSSIIRSGPAPGLHPHLAQGVPVQAAPVSIHTDKPKAIGAFLNFLQGEGIPNAECGEMRLALEEILNNAILHAFVDEQGNEKYRIGEFESLDESEQVLLEFGADEKTIGFSVFDSAGSLRRDTVLMKLENQFSNRTLFDPSGRGLFLSYRLADQLIFRLSPGSYTEIVVLFSRNASDADSDQTKPLLIFDRD